MIAIDSYRRCVRTTRLSPAQRRPHRRETPRVALGESIFEFAPEPEYRALEQIVAEARAAGHTAYWLGPAGIIEIGNKPPRRLSGDDRRVEQLVSSRGS